MAKKLKFIQKDKLIDVQISPDFYNRIQALIVYLGKLQTPEELNKALINLKNGPPQDEYEFHLLTVMIIASDIERKAEEQGKVEEKEVLPPNEESADS